jgi:ABC-type transport system substrate-binding protein
MECSLVRSILLVAALSAALTACGSSSTQTQSPSAAPTSGPATVSLAVLASAADPNALDGERAAVVDSLGDSFAAHIVVSPGACFTGLPARYGADYVLAIWDADEASVLAVVDDAGRRQEWIGQVTATCVD